MNLQNRIDLFIELGKYLMEDHTEWTLIKQKATATNPWFIPEFIDKAAHQIATQFLSSEKLMAWTKHYHLSEAVSQKTVGLVMAGNIPLVGFHDFLAVCISGHKQKIKLSSKDNILLPFLVEKMLEWHAPAGEVISIAENLKGCDAYIATGSNQSARYFEQYFAAYPHLIRRNRTSVAVLNGNENKMALEKLSDDIHLYFGLGCRNVTKIYVPRSYDFVPLLDAFHAYLPLRDHNKYANNYDYQLSILLLNNRYYMTNGSTLLTEQESIFSPISVLHYEYYDDLKVLQNQLQTNPDIQCVVGESFLPFGSSQQPGLFQYADGADSLEFLLTL